MKMKHKALSLLLALAMILTFMPAMAFAEGELEEGQELEQTNANYEQEQSRSVLPGRKVEVWPTYGAWDDESEWDYDVTEVTVIEGVEYLKEEYVCNTGTETIIRDGELFVIVDSTKIPEDVKCIYIDFTITPV